MLARFLTPFIIGALAGLVGACGAGIGGRAPLAPAAPSGMDLSALHALLRTGAVGSVEDLLARLPEAMRAQYVLVYESRSEQGASHEAPRAVLYNADATLVLTFNGEPNQSGYDRVETLGFDRRARRFQLQELRFERATRRVSASELNPPRCLRCHGREPRPIWDSYPSWPGVYGTRADGATPEELAALTRFVAARPAHPRYRYLLSSERWLERSSTRDALAYRGQLQLSPNADLGTKLLRLQYLAITRRLASSARFPTYQYALLAALNPQCLDLDSFVPRSTLTFARGFETFARNTHGANAAEELAKDRRQPVNAEAAMHTMTESLTSFRYVVERGLKLTSDDFTLAFERGSYDFSAPMTLTGVLETELVRLIAATDPDIRALYAHRHDEDEYCGALRRRSLRAIAGRLDR